MDERAATAPTPARAQRTAGGRSSRKRRFTVDSLFEDTSRRAAGVSDLVNAKEIRLDRIEPDPNQPRQTFDAERLDELAASIRREGVLQPIAVRYEPDRDRYILLHGERRWRAATLVGLDVIPAVVRDVPEERRLLQQLMENVVREDLNAVDRAAALRTLKAQLGDASWERVAEAVGIRRSRLFQLLGTEKLPDSVQAEIRAGRLSEKQSRVLQGLPDGPQEALARLIVDDGLGQSEAQRLARVVRGEPEFIEMEPVDLLGRLRELREVVAPRPARQDVPTTPSLAQALAAVLAADGTVSDGAERKVQDLLAHEGASPATPDRIEGLMRALALSVAQFPDLTLPKRRRAQLERRLRALRDLIDAALDEHAEPPR